MGEIISDADYNLRPELRQTYAKLLAYECPAEFKWAVQHPKDSKAFSFGCSAHVNTLENGDFESKVIVAPKIDKRTKVGKEEWAAFLAEAEKNGQQLISAEDWGHLVQMRHVLMQHKLAWSLITRPGRNELPIFWEQRGVKCKAKLDRLTDDGVLVDYKTCRNSKPHAFQRDFYKFGYHFQAAWYDSAARSIGIAPDVVAYVAQKSKPPYTPTVFTVPLLAIQVGLKDCERALEIYKQCKAANHWPGYSEDAIELGVPNWIVGDDVEIETDPSEEIEF